MYRIETVYRMRTVRDLGSERRARAAARPRAFRTTERRARAARAALNAQAVAMRQPSTPPRGRIGIRLLSRIIY